MPTTTSQKIANEAILLNSLRHVSSKLSIVLRSSSSSSCRPSITQLRRHVGEVYSMLWDCCYNCDGSIVNLVDTVVYPQHMPNVAPEAWIHRLADLEAVCSHDSLCGWISKDAGGTGQMYMDTDGMGGLEAHVAGVNADRQSRGLPPVVPLSVDPWPLGALSKTEAETQHVVYFEDDDDDYDNDQQEDSNNKDFLEQDDAELLGGPRIPYESLFQSVAVGGTFDGMHYGHRKLLTLAISSVNPVNGKLLIGVTADEMLGKKTYASLIPTLQQRMVAVKDFCGRLAPGLKNRIRVTPIDDAYGPPGRRPDDNNNQNDFDALVLSHETLQTGHALNTFRTERLGLSPLKLLCTRRTEVNGMSSTALRRMRNELQDQAET